MTPVETHAAQLGRIDLEPADVATPPSSIQSELVGMIAHNRLTGLALRAVEAGTLVLDPPRTEDLFERHDIAMTRTLGVEHTLLRAAQAIDAASLDFRVLKGSALAHAVATDPSDREFRDVDLLVRAAHLDEAVARLEAVGAARARPQLRPGFDSRFAKSVTLRLDGVEIDLHRVFSDGPFGVWTFPGDLFLLPASLEVGGRSLPTLDRTDHLVHACYHAALGGPSPALTSLRDIALLAQRDWDRERFAGTVERWQGRAVVARAVGLVESRLGWRLPEELTAYVPEPADEELLEPYLRPGDRFAALAAATFKVLPVSEKAAFARAVGFPEGSDPIQRIRSLAGSRRWKRPGQID